MRLSLESGILSFAVSLIPYGSIQEIGGRSRMRCGNIVDKTVR